MIRTFAASTLQLFNKSLAKHPYTTQAASSAVLWCIGDACSQKLLSPSPEHKLNKSRLALTTTYGGAIVGPAGHAWYIWLDRIASGAFRPLSPQFLAFKVLADSLVFGSVNIAVFFGILTISEGGSMQDVVKKLKTDFIPTFVAELAVWPALQWFNFAKVPVRNQLLVVNSATILDSTFLCWCRATDDWIHVVLPGVFNKSS